MSAPVAADPHAGKRYRFSFWNQEYSLVCTRTITWDDGETLLEFIAYDGLAIVTFEVGLVRCTPDD